MISETFKKQPKWRRWGTMIFLFLSIVFIIVSYLTPRGILSPDEWTEFNPFLSLMVLLLIFGSILGTRLGAWGVVVGIGYSLISNIFLSLLFGCSDNCEPLWLFPAYGTMWLIFPSLFFACIGFMIDRWLSSFRDTKKSV